MNLKETIRARVTECSKQALPFERDLLRVVLGEVQRKEIKNELDDNGVIKVLKKMREGNIGTIEAYLVADDPRVDVLKKEIEILDKYIPRSLSVEEILKELEPVADKIREAKADGPAMGVSMKLLKAAGLVVEGMDVSKAVGKIRGSDVL